MAVQQIKRRRNMRSAKREALRRKRRRQVLFGFILVCILLVWGISYFLLYRSVSKYPQNKICDNIYIGSVNVSGMTKDKAVLEANHEKAANDIEAYLKEGKQVAFLTLGDPTVYSTYLYVHKRILSRGYEVEIVSGITSFCAVAARLNMGLVEMAEPLHVIPATYRAEEMDEILKMPGTKVLMKTGSKMQQVKESIVNSGQQAVMIENCGMPDEKIYLSAEDIPEKAGYYSLIIVKENK